MSEADWEGGFKCVVFADEGNATQIWRSNAVPEVTRVAMRTSPGQWAVHFAANKKKFATFQAAAAEYLFGE